MLKLIGTGLAFFSRARPAEFQRVVVFVSKGDAVLRVQSPRRLIQWYLSGLRAEDNEKRRGTERPCPPAHLQWLSFREGLHLFLRRALLMPRKLARSATADDRFAFRHTGVA